MGTQVARNARNCHNWLVFEVCISCILCYEMFHLSSNLKIIEHLLCKLSMLSLFKLLINVRTKVVLNIMGATRMLWHELLNIVYFALEKDDLVVFLVFLPVLFSFFLSFEYSHFSTHISFKTIFEQFIIDSN